MEEQLRRRAFVNKPLEWRRRGNFACRHGVLFLRMQGRAFPCLGPHVHEAHAWEHARWMPALDPVLQALIAVPFNLKEYVRLGVLQSRFRHSGR